MDNTLPIVINEGLTHDQVRFINAYISFNCHVSNACQEIGISRTTFYRWRIDSDKFHDAVEQAQEGLKDRIENEIYKHIFEDRNPIVLNKFAPSILKDRGFADAKDINLSGVMQNDNEVIVTIVDGGEITDYES